MLKALSLLVGEYDRPQVTRTQTWGTQPSTSQAETTHRQRRVPVDRVSQGLQESDGLGVVRARATGRGR